MSPALANFLFEAGNFLLLAAGLGWLLFRPVRRVLEAERERHERERQETSRLRAEAESLVREARHAREQAESDMEKRRLEVLNGAREEAALVLEKARQDERTEREAFEAERAKARSVELMELASSIGCVAADAVRRMLESVQGPSLDLALTRAACEELGSLPAEARRAAQVECARALDPEAKRLLQSALGCNFSERVVAELGAGVRVKTSAGQVDATTSSLARHAGRVVSRFACETSTPPAEGRIHD